MSPSTRRARAYRFSRGQPGRALDAGEVVAHLVSDGGTDAFVWLHCPVSNVASERSMRERLSVPEIFHALMKEGAGSTRLEQDESRLVAQRHEFAALVVALAIATGVIAWAVTWRPRD